MRPAPQPSLFPPPPVAEQVLVGIATAVVATLAEVVLCAFPRGTPDAGAGDVAVGVLYIGAMLLPLGLLVGLAFGVIAAALRRAGWAERARRAFGQRGALVRRDPEAFATTAAVVIVLGAAFLGGARAAEYFATSFHDPALASYAMAGVVVGLLVVALPAVAVVTAVVRPVAGVLGPLARPLSVVVAVLLGAAVVGYLLRERFELVLHVYDEARLAWGPGLFVTWLVLAIVTRRMLRRRGTPASRVRRWAVVGAVLAVGAGVVGGATYGTGSRVRTVVESRSAVGRTLLRFYLRLTDRDGDGHAFAWGGADCDDFRADVHPGAADPGGDGLDADCFHGDGSPDLSDLSDGDYGRVPSAVPPRPNVLLVTVDALRFDHLGTGGYRRRTSPHIDRFARGSIVFTDVTAQSSRSIRSIPSMMTGFAPSQIAFGSQYLWPGLSPENIVLAELLKQQGYATAAAMGTGYFSRSEGFFQGFDDVVQDTEYKPPRGRVIDDALRLFEARAGDTRPWFLWVHLFNTHLGYLSDGMASRFGTQEVDKYDEEIVQADLLFQRLLDALAARQLLDRTIVVLASDHGEAFGEHDNWGHSFTLYEEELKAALMMRVPGMTARRIDAPVALMDLAPTLLNLLRIPVPRPMPARSLVPLMTGQGRLAPDRLLVSELMPDGQFPFDLKTIRRGDLKLHWWVREGTVALHDLATDPGERVNLADDRPEETAELLGLVRAWTSTVALPMHRQDDVVRRNRLSAPPAVMTRRVNAVSPRGFTLLGFDLPRSEFSPGQSIPVTLYFQVAHETDSNIYFVMQLEGPPGVQLPGHMHGDHYPMNGRYFTTMWRPGEILRDPVAITVPRTIQHPITLRLTLRQSEGGGYVDWQGLGPSIELAEIRIR